MLCLEHFLLYYLFVFVCFIRETEDWNKLLWISIPDILLQTFSNRCSKDIMVKILDVVDKMANAISGLWCDKRFVIVESKTNWMNWLMGVDCRMNGPRRQSLQTMYIHLTGCRYRSYKVVPGLKKEGCRTIVLKLFLNVPIDPCFENCNTEKSQASPCLL